MGIYLSVYALVLFLVHLTPTVYVYHKERQGAAWFMRINEKSLSLAIQEHHNCCRGTELSAAAVKAKGTAVEERKKGAGKE